MFLVQPADDLPVVIFPGCEILGIDPEKVSRIKNDITPSLLDAMRVKGKLASEKAVAKVLEGLLASIPEENDEEKIEAKQIFYDIEKKLFRSLVLDRGERTDGRKFDEVRPIDRGRRPERRFRHGHGTSGKGD